MAEAPHALGLIDPDFAHRFRSDENHRRIRCFHRFGKASGDPLFGAGFVVGGDEHRLLARSGQELGVMIADRFAGVGDLMVMALLQLAQEGVLDGRGPHPCGAEVVEVHVAFVERQKPLFPSVRNRAFFGQQGSRAELKRDRPKLGIVDPVLPFAQEPHAARHNDRRFAEAEFAHPLAQLEDPRIGIFGVVRVFAVGKTVVSAGAPRVFVDDAAEKLGEFVIGALPQRAECPAGRDDRIVVNPEMGRDLGHFVGHPGATGDAVHQFAGAFENANQNAFGSSHFPQDVHVDRPAPAGNFVGDLGLGDATVDGVLNELFVPLDPGAAGIVLRDQAPVGVV